MTPWQVRYVMTTDVATVREDSPYREIVDLLTSRHISAVPVVDDFRRVLGVVSEADLMYKVELIGEPHERRTFESRQRRRAHVKADAAVARELMTTPAVTVQPGASVVAAAKLMDHEDVKRLPVVDDLGRLVGVVTRSDPLKVHLRPDADIRNDVVHGVLRGVLAIEDGVVRVEVTDGVVRSWWWSDRATGPGRATSRSVPSDICWCTGARARSPGSDGLIRAIRRAARSAWTCGEGLAPQMSLGVRCSGSRLARWVRRGGADGIERRLS